MDFKILALAVFLLAPGPALAQHVYKCINWQGVSSYHSDRCPQGHRQDRIYSPTHVDLDGRAVRNFVPTTGGSPDALAPSYGRPMNADGSAKSDALCGVAQAATASRPYRNIELLASDAALRSAHCNHSRGPGN